MATINLIVGDRALEAHSIRNDSGAHDATKVVVNGRHLSYLSPKGKMFSTRVGVRSGYYGRRWYGHSGLVGDAVKLGVLPKKAMDALLAREAVHRKKRDAKYAANNVADNAARAGITLSAEQKLQIKRASAYRGRKEDR